MRWLSTDVHDIRKPLLIPLLSNNEARKCPHSETFLRPARNHGNKETFLNPVTNLIMVTLISKRPR